MSDAIVAIGPLHEALDVCEPTEEAVLPLLTNYVALLPSFREERHRVLEYLLHPLRKMLLFPSSKVRHVALSGLREVLDEERISTSAVLSLCEGLTMCLSDTQSEYSSEEVRLAAAQCLSKLIERKELFAGAFWKSSKALRGLFGWILSQLLECVAKEQLKALRLEALSNAARLFEAMMLEPGVAASFYPGYVSALQRVCCGDFKQGQEITLKALAAFTDAICFVFEQPLQSALDVADPFQSLRSRDSSLALQTAEEKPPDAPEDLSFLVNVESLEWRQPVAEKSIAAVNRVVKYVHRTYAEEHDEVAVRAALASSCGRFAACASDLLEGCMSELVDTLVLYASDEWPQVASVAAAVLDQIAQTSRATMVKRSVQNSLHALILALPRVVRSATDSDKLTKVRLAAGYAQFLGDEFPTALAVSQAAFVEAVVQVTTLDRRWGAAPLVSVIEGAVSKRDLHIQNQALFAEKSPASVVVSCPAPLQYCASVPLTKAAFQLCRVLAHDRKSASNVLSNLLMRLETLSDDSPECLLVCALMVDGFPVHEEEALLKWVARVLSVVTSTIAESASVEPLVLALSCFFISHALQRLQGAMKPQIREALPFLLQCLGHGDERVSDMAWTGLELLTLALGESSVHVTIRQYADYVVDRVVKDLRSARLSRSGETARVPFAVYGILRHSPTNATWLLDDILGETIALLDSSSKRDAELAVFAKILSEIALALWTAVEQEQHRQQKEGAPEAAPPDDEEVDEFEIPATAEQTIARKILDRVRNFIPCRLLPVQLDSLECVKSCLRVLAQSRKELLPGIYAVWDSLMKRLEAFDPLSDSSLALCIHIASVVGLIGELGTDFLAGEKFERLWKSLSRLLKWGLDANASRAAAKDAAFYASTFAFRLQKAWLECLVQYSLHVPLRGEKRDSVLEMMQRFQARDATPAPLRQLAAQISENNRKPKMN